MQRNEVLYRHCKICGQGIRQLKSEPRQLYCSDKCREMAEHMDSVNEKIKRDQERAKLATKKGYKPMAQLTLDTRRARACGLSYGTYIGYKYTGYIYRYCSLTLGKGYMQILQEANLL